MTDFQATILNTLESEREAETRFLAELVKVPSDNPPGDCVAHAERAAFGALHQDHSHQCDGEYQMNDENNRFHSVSVS